LERPTSSYLFNIELDNPQVVEQTLYNSYLIFNKNVSMLKSKQEKPMFSFRTI